MKHYLVVSQDGAQVGLKHEGCPSIPRCPYTDSWNDTMRGPNTFPMPDAFEHYGDGEHEVRRNIFGELQGVDTKVPWVQPLLEDE